MTSDNVTAAKAIRAELRALAKSDPRLSGAKVSVTAGHASLMSEVNVRITGYAHGAAPDRNDTGVRDLACDLWAVVEKHWQADSRMRFSGLNINGRSF